ncbi:hypothetical protein BDM02DRAFT_3152142 [Thelephora ganbajun]|uniref:Uncharacterized protein n=1 Tax=Thelephora ganbajun TaxID=370292 RepID=A0ACB6YZZ7_THEGA|nr:hypothetical protein BDM02DRAFT_3152142 [Thelephora ganbajun]
MVAAPKRPARRKPNVQYNEQESSEPSDDGLDSNSSPPPRKRARGRAVASVSKAKKGKEKQASKLLEMPLDVMFEILSCVEPRDLLQLSRTSKALRGVIMSKSNKFIWFNSFAANEEAPECPEDISEPAWAQLLYSPFCQHCYSSRATDVYWVSYRRLCKKCIPEVVTSHVKAMEDAVEIGLRSAFNEVGFTSFSKVLPGLKLRAGKQALPYYFTGDLHEFLEAALEWYNSHNRADITPFLKKYGERLKARVQHADRCLSWERKQRNHRQEEKEEERTKRYDEVVARLGALGWEDELKKHKDWYEGMQSLPPMNSSKPVTDKVWNICKERILQFMRAQRDKRLHTEHAKTIKSRYREIEKIVSTYQRTHHPHDFFISTLDICESPGVSQSIVDPSDEVFQERLATVSDLIPITHALALEKRRREILKLLPEGLTADALALAVSWFRCRYCSRSFHYAGAIKHSCYMLRMWSYRTYEEIKAIEPLEQVYHLCGQRMWNTERLAYWKDAAELTKQVIESAGMDPNKVTPDELDDAKHRFAIFTGTGSSAMTIVGWRCLVTGRYDKYPSTKRAPEWRIMKPGEMPEFKHPSVRLEKEDWACLHCWTNNAEPYDDMPWASVKLHIKEKHSVDKPTEDDYYCVRPTLQSDYFLREIALM